jgi:hypothetical protein
MPLSGMVNGEAGSTKSIKKFLKTWDNLSSSRDITPLLDHIPLRRTNYGDLAVSIMI